MAYPGYGGAVSPGSTSAASAPAGWGAPAGGARVRGPPPPASSLDGSLVLRGAETPRCVGTWGQGWAGSHRCSGPWGPFRRVLMRQECAVIFGNFWNFWKFSSWIGRTKAPTPTFRSFARRPLSEFLATSCFLSFKLLMNKLRYAKCLLIFTIPSRAVCSRLFLGGGKD